MKSISSILFLFVLLFHTNAGHTQTIQNLKSRHWTLHLLKKGSGFNKNDIKKRESMLDNKGCARLDGSPDICFGVLDPGTGLVLKAPFSKFIIGYDQGETRTKYVYAFSSEGKVLNKIEANLYPIVRFSANGSYAVISDMFGPKFIVVNDKGRIVYQCDDYKKLNIPKEEPLLYVDISDKGDFVLVSSSGLRKIRIKDQKTVWHSSRNIDNSFIDHTKNRIYTTCTSDNPRLTDIVIFDLNTGKELDRLTGFEYAYFAENKLFITHQNESYEYEI